MRRWLLLGICALLTWRQIPRFADDLALWRSAAVRSQAVRPAVNLAAQYIVRRDYDLARMWIAEARERVAHPSRARERGPVLVILERQETWIDAFSSLQP
jgi:hypothetical protein